MGPCFDAYLIVDWSAACQPKRGADSLWYALVERDEAGALGLTAVCNPPTRLEARAAVRALLLDQRARDRRILVGCDFSYGYPRGLARRLAGAPEAGWREVWAALAQGLEEGPRNRNNRFALAAALNRRLSGGPFPFWGCPASQAGPGLTPTKPAGYGPETLAYERACERLLRGAKVAWQLFYTGSVGGQSLTGIPAVAAWRDDPALAAVSRVWPFEVGLGRLAPGDWRVLHAEVYPSLLPLPEGPGVKDRRQVEALAWHFARLDAEGRLAELFEGPRGTLEAEERRAIEREEGWILGLR
jgi:hypothetical protein